MIRQVIACAAIVGIVLWSQAGRAAEPSCGAASFYSYTGHRTASGEVFTGNAMTAAHRTLPFGTIVRVTDQVTGRTVTVRITDRGPFIRGRILDLSRAAASALGIINRGVARVCLTPLNRGT